MEGVQGGFPGLARDPTLKTAEGQGEGVATWQHLAALRHKESRRGIRSGSPSSLPDSQPRTLLGVLGGPVPVRMPTLFAPVDSVEFGGGLDREPRSCNLL